MTPVGGSAALVVDRSPEPESSAADQDGTDHGYFERSSHSDGDHIGGPHGLGFRRRRRLLRHNIDGRFANLELEKMVGETF
jgi:hypothetical protein